MSRADAFVHPEWGPYSIDSHHLRVSILKAVQDALPLFHGTILDVGCGEMPYRDLLLEAPSRATRYIGLDLAGTAYSRHQPDVFWNGAVIPLRDASVESALATEVLEHCPEPLRTLSEIHRVLKPGGVLLITVPFLWPIHDPPYDEYRYTPFSLERSCCARPGLRCAAFELSAAGMPASRKCSGSGCGAGPCGKPRGVFFNEWLLRCAVGFMRAIARRLTSGLAQ